VCFLGNIFSASLGTAEGKPKTHAQALSSGSERLRKQGEKRDNWRLRGSSAHVSVPAGTQSIRKKQNKQRD